MSFQKLGLIGQERTMYNGEEKRLVKLFPNLKNCTFKVTSPRTPDYNCIAWAAGDDYICWDPTVNFHYWPKRVPRERTLDAFILAFNTARFEVCENGDYEKEYEKIAIFVLKNGEPMHVARQLDSTRWTSKIGIGVDIEHELYGLAGDIYGQIGRFMRRPKTEGKQS